MVGVTSFLRFVPVQNSQNATSLLSHIAITVSTHDEASTWIEQAMDTLAKMPKHYLAELNGN